MLKLIREEEKKEKERRYNLDITYNEEIKNILERQYDIERSHVWSKL
jgi:hypothetical protein